ncbi:MAG: hypothetical protein ACKOTA_10520 [Solirubrobacterales bacterium]
MSSQQPDIESLLRMALKPVEPPDTLTQKHPEDIPRIVDLSTAEQDSWQADPHNDPVLFVHGHLPKSTTSSLRILILLHPSQMQI